MKKKSIIITGILLSGVSVCFFGQKTSADKPVSKNINVEVYKTSSYISPAYKDAYATLEVTVVKINGDKRDTAWKHSFTPTQLKDFPESSKPLVQKVTIPNVNDGKERLEINYRLTYTTKGSELHFSNAEIIGKGEQTRKLNIKI